MFRITEDPSPGSLVQCLAKNYKNDSIGPLTWTRSVLWQHIVTRCVCVYTVHSIGRHCLYSASLYCGLYARTTGQIMLP